MPKSKKLSALKSAGISARINPNGVITFRKIGIEGKRLKTDPAFKRTRENMAEFSHAANVGKLIRHAFKPWMGNWANPDLAGNLVKILLQIIQSDNANPRGRRSILNPDLKLLEGFDFGQRTRNAPSVLPLVFRWKKGKKQCSLKTKAIALDRVCWCMPNAATHVRIFPSLAVINPATRVLNVFSPASVPPIGITEESIPPLGFAANIDIAGPHIILVTVLIEFSQCVNGQYCLLNARDGNSLTIVKSWLANP
jgi:hypothetical protein